VVLNHQEEDVELPVANVETCPQKELQREEDRLAVPEVIIPASDHHMGLQMECAQDTKHSADPEVIVLKTVYALSKIHSSLHKALNFLLG
jgi:hypothetical protein